eukprot:UN3133
MPWHLWNALEPLRHVVRTLASDFPRRLPASWCPAHWGMEEKSAGEAGARLRRKGQAPRRPSEVGGAGVHRVHREVLGPAVGAGQLLHARRVQCLRPLLDGAVRSCAVLAPDSIRPLGEAGLGRDDRRDGARCRVVALGPQCAEAVQVSQRHDLSRRVDNPQLRGYGARPRGGDLRVLGRGAHQLWFAPTELRGPFRLSAGPAAWVGR